MSKRNRQHRGSTAMSNPFEDNVPTSAVATEEAPPAELAEVDTPEALDDETDEVPATAAGEGAKPQAEKKEKAPARATPPEGYITPVQFAKELTKHLSDKEFKNKN